MLDPHYSLAIAQTIFYLPAVPIAIYLIVRNWNNRPRLAFWPQVPFSIMRLVGGICTIVLYATKDYSNLGLVITAIVFLNVGAIPLIVASTGMARLVLKDTYPPNHRANKLAKFFRIAFIIAVSLLTSAGSLSGNKDTANIAHILGEAGYAVFAAVIVFLACLYFYLYRRISEVPPTSRIYLRLAIIALPFIALRTAYGLLYESDLNNVYSTWNPLLGNVYAFAFMALVPEYIVMCLYFYLGFYRIKQCQREPDTGNVDSGPKAGEV